MRALAENQNTLNRMRKQVDDAKVYGVQNLVKDLLEVGFPTTSISYITDYFLLIKVFRRFANGA